jgi:hypothetical protein
MTSWRQNFPDRDDKVYIVGFWIIALYIHLDVNKLCNGEVTVLFSIWEIWLKIFRTIKLYLSDRYVFFRIILIYS